MKIKTFVQVAFYALVGLLLVFRNVSHFGPTGTASTTTCCTPTAAPAGVVRITRGSFAEGPSTLYKPIGGDEACIDINGVARICTAVDAYASTLSRLWWCWMSFVYVFYGVYAGGLLWSATLPLRYGDVGTRPYETMSYFRRLMAVTSLWAVSGGATFMFIFADVHIASWIWTTWGTEDCFVVIAVFVLFNFIFMRPLPHRFPTKEFLRSKLFALWREYFDFRAVNEFGEVMDVDNLPKDKQYLLAQLPHGVMPFGAMLGSSMLPELLPGLWPVSGVVATALMTTPVLRTFINYLGVRKAGTESIHQMFADGFKAVGVVTGGIAEMYVSRSEEVLLGLRKGFGHIAIKGGHDIVPVYVFGASLTHSVFPLFNHWVCKALSRKAKAPLMMFWGAFGFVPHRQQLKMVIGRPIAVTKVTEGVTNEDALEVCKEVQDSVIDIYDRQKPFWEVRPISFTK